MLISILAIVVVRAFVQGRTSNSGQNMHSRVVLLTVRMVASHLHRLRIAHSIREDSLR
ncbi:hypothetical protein BDR07DRAFT_1422006 [Suillus spraguei]|nr:hypothetical protein BDR07DRAFT_1422006 [Suillus spraguei]